MFLPTRNEMRPARGRVTVSRALLLLAPMVLLLSPSTWVLDSLAELSSRATSPGFVRPLADRISIAGQPLRLFALAGLPDGVTESEALAAGFNTLLGPGEGGFRLLRLPESSSELAGFVTQHRESQNVIGWVGPDEPAWTGVAPEEIAAAYRQPLVSLDPYRRPFLLNHAPRGTAAEPGNFEALLPYLALSDLVSMDIYPIPSGSGHSILPAHPGITAVAAHADLLRDLVARGGSSQPLLMVLQGVGRGRWVPGDLERWQTDEALAPQAVVFAQAADFDGDGSDELAVGVQEVGAAGRVLSYDFWTHTWGGRSAELEIPQAALDLSGYRASAAGDFDGDGDADLFLAVIQGEDRHELWWLPSTGAGFADPRLVLSRPRAQVNLEVVHHLLAGDFDGDGCADVLASYDFPGPEHQVWFLLPSECSGFPLIDGVRVWYQASTARLDLERIRHARTADANRDGSPDLIVAYETPGEAFEVLQLLGMPAGLSEPQRVLAHSTAQTVKVPHFFIGDFDGDGRDEYVIGFVSPRDYQVLFLGRFEQIPYDARGLEVWLGTFADTLGLASLRGATAGDLDGDGRSDFVFVEPFGSATRLSIGFSAGTHVGGRDPLEKETWFMAMEALVHGAAGTVFWGQHLVGGESVAWRRLQRVGARLARLEPVLAGATLTRARADGFAWWWVRGPEPHVIVTHERDEAMRMAPPLPLPQALPQGVSRGSVDLWEDGSYRPYPQATLGLSLADSVPFAPYEVRILALRP
jgi:hypothetical protein